MVDDTEAAPADTTATEPTVPGEPPGPATPGVTAAKPPSPDILDRYFGLGALGVIGTARKGFEEGHAGDPFAGTWESPEAYNAFLKNAQTLGSDGGEPGLKSVAAAFNNTVVIPAFRALDEAVKIGSGFISAGQSLVYKFAGPSENDKYAGGTLGKDLAAMPMAFMGGLPELPSPEAVKAAGHEAEAAARNPSIGLSIKDESGKDGEVPPDKAPDIPVDTTKLTPATVPVAKELKVGPAAPDEGVVPPKLGPQAAADEAIQPAMLSVDDKGQTVLNPLSESSLDYAAKNDAARATPGKAGNIRLDLSDTSQGAIDIIKRAADENGDFIGPRTGGLPLMHIQALADAAGVDPATVNWRDVGRTLTNDQVVNRAYTAMKQSSEGVFTAMQKVKGDNDIEGMIAAEDALLQHAPAQEIVAGLNAEWARAGHVISSHLTGVGPKIRDAIDMGEMTPFEAAVAHAAESAEAEAKAAGKTPEETAVIVKLVKEEAESAGPPGTLENFRKVVKDRETLEKWLMEQHGETIDQFHQMITEGRSINAPEGFAKYLGQRRPPPSAPRPKGPVPPTAWDKYVYSMKNAYLSGPFTHLGYAASLFGLGLYEAGLVGLASGVIKSIREGDAGHLGEPIARLGGAIAGTPRAFISAYKTLVSGVREPLPVKDADTFNQINPISGIMGQVIGLPTRVIGSIGVLFRDLAFHAELGARAWRTALDKTGEENEPGFATRLVNAYKYPTEEALDSAVKYGAYAHYTNELGPKGKAVQRAIKALHLEPIIPFTTVPMNILKMALENSPAAFLSKDLRDNLLGKNGDDARDTAWARLIVGSATGTWLVHMALSNGLTDSGPTDPGERREWLLTHQPDSIKVNGYWVDVRRFGMASSMMQTAAGLAAVGKHLYHGITSSDPDISEAEYNEAAARFTIDAGNLLSSSAGLQSVFNVAQALKDPKYAMRFVRNFSASQVPFSTLLSQMGSAQDPYLRQTNSFVQSLQAHIPGYAWGYGRETLPVVRDWSGLAMANPGYRAGAIERNEPVHENPVNMELQSLGIHPAPLDRIVDGIRLNDAQWDDYQGKAGVLTHSALNSLVNSPGWYEIPAKAREMQVRAAIEGARAQAKMVPRTAPGFIQQSLGAKVAPFLGQVQKPDEVRVPKPTYKAPDEQ